jgi:hypothetical protein
MNSLGDLRTFFQSVGKTVSDYTGYSFKSDGIVWGLAFENPVADGVEMAPLDWKIYVKALKSAKSMGEPVNFKPLINRPLFPEVVKTPIIVPPRNPVITKISGSQITCPHCGKSGGVIGMKRWHFDKCKDKK